MSASRDKSIRMWDASTGMCLMTLVSNTNENGPSLIIKKAKVQFFNNSHLVDSEKQMALTLQ